MGHIRDYSIQKDMFRFFYDNKTPVTARTLALILKANPRTVSGHLSTMSRLLNEHFLVDKKEEPWHYSMCNTDSPVEALEERYRFMLRSLYPKPDRAKIPSVAEIRPESRPPIEALPQQRKLDWDALTPPSGNRITGEITAFGISIFLDVVVEPVTGRMQA